MHRQASGPPEVHSMCVGSGTNRLSLDTGCISSSPTRGTEGVEGDTPDTVPAQGARASGKKFESGWGYIWRHLL